MAGHSKWANIKRHKAKQDAKRGKLYTKIIREVTVAAKMGGADANANPRLRAALDKAQEANMTKDVIERAIKRGAGGMEGENVEEVRYEGYGPGGIAVMVDCMTNNRNRTVAEVRHAFSKHGGNLGTDGSVAYLFKKQGQITFAPGADEERLMEHALEAGAEDIIVNDDKSIDVITAPENFIPVKDALQKAGFQSVQADVTMIAGTSVSITDKETAETVMGLIDALEDLDDVQSVYSNADIMEEIMEQLS
ncbi:YebC/PmpR family DNA-binding transcriptional regulator [Aquicella lusitana]|uniref:Probable transcriptional regulatory protein C8D86_11746 n=1 Tax=Aquicella lusitana TaxID=254246 RepID=A0A370GFE4_9COXI|nr:YebC/PmpR family DNA-binding transcriptional regulator [Aquicella lusitana]RDI41829.1 YebC/PmpR family DNA-binding regulatory protein [Aquicella lusitana]VVC73737.1 putative transcriptional regulatory protein [Aquicella lusitana]